MKKLLVIGLMLIAANAMAGLDPATDGIGIYFDQGGNTNCLASATPYTTLNAYLIATNISESSGISGWEATIATNPTTFPAGINYTLVGGGINVLTAPVFQVGLPAALPYSPAITLVSISTFYLGGVVKFGIGPCVPTSFPGRPGPGYAKGSDPGVLKSLMPSAADVVEAGFIPAGAVFPANYYWVAGVATTCVVANQPDSWGNVKSLYQ